MVKDLFSFHQILALVESLSPFASALLLLNVHVLFICCNSRIVHFILLEQYTVIKILIVDVIIFC